MLFKSKTSLDFAENMNNLPTGDSMTSNILNFAEKREQSSYKRQHDLNSIC